MKVKLTTAHGVYTAKVKQGKKAAETAAALVAKYAQGQAFELELKA